jgi:hypothetical protein
MTRLIAHDCSCIPPDVLMHRQGWTMALRQNAATAAGSHVMPPSPSPPSP